MPIGTDLIRVFVLPPVDRIVSKIARLSGPDTGDIASIVAALGVTSKEIEQRAESALKGYVGNVDYLRMNLRNVV